MGAAAVRKTREFDPDRFLATIGEGGRILAVPKKQTIFVQGDVADAVFYIQKGRVRLTVVSNAGKEAPIAIWSVARVRWRGRCVVWDRRWP
jgi:CRP/FNR family transcriptional regulator, cyclic AMP receptor protein